ncbi:MAG: ATP-binding protein [Solirubrobacterales bacterium]|nr:ATP-binding protein [Solirubrobacterales bacterium]
MAEQPRTQRPSESPGGHPGSSVLTGGGQSVSDEVIRGLLPRTRGCGSVARGLLTEQLSDRVDALTLEDARLVVSELANNAYLHGQGVIELTVEIFSDRLRVELSDEGANAQLRVRDGHGLQIVEALVSAWGAYAGTTHVWAELLIHDG